MKHSVSENAFCMATNLEFKCYILFKFFAPQVHAALRFQIKDSNQLHSIVITHCKQFLYEGVKLIKH